MFSATTDSASRGQFSTNGNGNCRIHLRSKNEREACMIKLQINCVYNFLDSTNTTTSIPTGFAV